MENTPKLARIKELKEIRKTIYKYSEYTPADVKYSEINYTIAEATMAISKLIKLIK